MKDPKSFILGLVVGPLIAIWLVVASADSVMIPNNFVAGDVASADDVNQNFDAVASSINDNDSRITALEDGKTLLTYATGVGDFPTDSGVVTGRSLTFNKASASSVLRITYSDSFRVIGSSKGAKWEVLLDAASIATPGALEIHLYAGTSTGHDHHRASTLVGYAEGVSSGSHTLTVQVGAVGAVPLADTYTGWQSRRWLLQVEEVAAP